MNTILNQLSDQMVATQDFYDVCVVRSFHDAQTLLSQQLAELLDGETGVLDDVEHGEGIDGIVARHNHFAHTVRHHDMPALSFYDETGTLKCSNGTTMRDSRKLPQTTLPR